VQIFHRAVLVGTTPESALISSRNCAANSKSSVSTALFNFFWSLRNGKSAGANPWRSTTLEWTVPSPPPHGNFAEMPTVYRGPYEYGLPGRADDFLPQNVPDQAVVGD
jgi:heme/copper-type cytochrome/quinol oxidase subunit 1